MDKIKNLMIKLFKGKWKDASAYNSTPIGTIKKIDGFKYKLTNKWQISLHKCPHCESEKTFHGERMKTMEKEFQKTGKLYDNIIDSKLDKEGNGRILQKYDMCLDCGHKWAMEIFCWDKVSGYNIQYWNFDKKEVYTK